MAEKHAASYHLERQLCSKTHRRTIETTSVSHRSIRLMLKLSRRHEFRGTNETIANRPQSENARPLNDEETGQDLMQQRLASNRSAIS